MKFIQQIPELPLLNIAKPINSCLAFILVNAPPSNQNEMEVSGRWVRFLVKRELRPAFPPQLMHTASNPTFPAPPSFHVHPYIWVSPFVAPGAGKPCFHILNISFVLN
jgi:hypothetical protein